MVKHEKEEETLKKEPENYKYFSIINKIYIDYIMSEINAFTPLHQRPIPQMLFDHALLKGNMEGIDFTVGNLMALSAPGKGMKKNTTTNAKTLSKNVNENGGKLTEEFIKIVKKIVGYKVENDEDLNEDIKYIQKNWGKELPIPHNFKELLKAEIKNERYDGEKSLMYRVGLEIGLPPGMTTTDEMITAIEGEIDDSTKDYYALQSLGNNKIWDAQNLGGFELPKNSLYQNIQGEKMGENNSIVSPTVELLVEAAIPNNGILFLCESALLFGHDGKPDDPENPKKGNMLDGTEINHILDHKDTKYEKVYSAIWMRNDIAVKKLDIDISTGNDPEIIDDIRKEDYCVFSVRKEGSEVAKVVVVHANDKVAGKKGKSDKWINFLQNCQRMGGNIYVVGDTNVTKSKTKTNTTDFVPFTVDGGYVENAIVTGFDIIKRRVPGNIWKNNQIYKFQPTNEPDGMVILKLKPSSSVEATDASTKVAPASADTTGAAFALDTAPAADAADGVQQPRQSVVKKEVDKIRKGFRGILSSFGRKKGGKRKKKTKRKKRKKSRKKRTKRKR